MTQTTTVRVHPHTRQAIAELSAQRGVTMTELLEELVAHEQDRVLLAAMNRHFAGRTVGERAEAAHERDAWEHTVLDGLATS